MPTHSIPEIDEIFKRARERFNEGMDDTMRDIEVLEASLMAGVSPREMVDAVESDRLLRKLPADAPEM